MDKKREGQITVFLSLVLLLLFSMIFTCLESARSEGLALRARLAAEAAAESVFAQYDRALWKNYGLLYFCERLPGEAEVIAGAYAQKNAAAGNLFGGDHFGLRVESVTADRRIRAVEQQGAVFRRSVRDYMAACGVIGAAEETYEKLQADKVTAAEELDMDRMQQQMEEAAAAAERPEAEAVLPEAPEITQEESDGFFRRLLKDFRKWRREGILSLTVPDLAQISEERYDLAGCPSSLSYYEKNRESADLGGTGIGDTLLLSEYAIRHLDDYITSDGSRCQVEYVITGKSSDRDCLNSVAKRLMGIRYAFNLEALSADSIKCGAAGAMATAVSGWTGSPVIIKAVTGVILMVWAFAESVTDVRSLFSGKRVPLQKKTGDWIVTMKNMGKDISQIHHDEEGLSYEDYLRILLNLCGKTGLTYRIMDMVELGMREIEPEFSFSACIYGARFTVRYSGKGIFPFLPDKVSYDLSETVGYAYGKVTAFSGP